MVGFGITTEAGRLDYVISKSDFNDFMRNIDMFRMGADMFNANGKPSENMIAYIASSQNGDFKGMAKAVWGMWNEPGAARDALLSTLIGGGARSVAGNGIRNAAKGGMTVLEGAVKSNYGRFVSKIPANAKSSATFKQLKDGNYLFEATSPGKVPGSSALYQKWVNPQGETFKMLKTTFAPDGSIVHIKPK